MKKHDDNTSTMRDTLRFYWEASSQHKKYLFLSLLLPASQVLLSVAIPFFASKVIANLIFSETAMTYFWLLVASAVLGLWCNFVGIRNNMRMQARTMATLHSRVYDKLMMRSLAFFNNQIGGKLVSDALDFTNSYSTLVNNALIKAAGFIVVVVSGLILLAINTPSFAILIFILLVFLTSWTAHESRRRSALRASRLKAYKQLASHLSDTVVNMPTVKSFASESYELKIDNTLNTKLAATREKDWTRAVSNETIRVSVIIFMQIALILALLLMSQRDTSIIASGIFAFTYSVTITTRFFEINTITRMIEESLLQAAPMTKILQSDIEVRDAPHAKAIQITKGEIAVQDISFYYPDNHKNQKVFDGLNISIKPGEKIGLIGKSGSGKSTLTRLLLRFEDVSKGAISIDGQNIAEVSQASLRKSIAYVPQEPLLFHRSIRDNIGYGKEHASDADITAAAKKAFAHVFIAQLPQGLDTIVGERGVKLSGGQRQRIAIARAILKDAPILILDEATSALDSESELFIQKALQTLMEDRTAIVIAHRLSTVQKMDRIIVMEHGRIVEQGTHKELLSRNGTYATLWKHQSGGFLEDDEPEDSTHQE